MKNFFTLLLLTVFTLTNFSPALAMLKNSDEIANNFPKTVFEKTQKQIENNQKNSDPNVVERENTQFDNWEWRNMRSILQIEQQGGLPAFGYRSNEFEALDILTGKSSMDDAMQIGDFTSGTENEKQFLRNVKTAIESYKDRSNENQYPKSLEDFRKYQDEWWAGIRMEGGERRNIADVAEFFEYESIELEKRKVLFSSQWRGITNKKEIAVIAKKLANDEFELVEFPSGNNSDSLLDAQAEMENFIENYNNFSQEKLKYVDMKMPYLSILSEDNRFEKKLRDLKFVYTNDCTFAASNNCIERPWAEYSYSLSFKKSPQKNFSIDAITPVETKSHDFEELLKKLPQEKKSLEIPQIYSLIPSDTFSVYFSDPQKYKEFTQTMGNPLSELAQIAPLPTVTQMEKMIGDRLGIGDPQKFLGLVEEFVFVGEDIRIFPSSDFAVIFTCKNDLLCNFSNAEQVGDYFVLATDKKLLEKIRTVGEENLADEKDFQYAWQVTEHRRDGFIFFSDAFIRKMVSPEYRINLRRQKAVVEAMNALQYVVWAYKAQEKKFPKTIAELEDKNYIAKNSVYQKEKYSIGTNCKGASPLVTENRENQQGGLPPCQNEDIVHHQIWGTPFNITPVTQVDITQVSEREKIWYEEKRDIYASNYQEFFDPVGISISVADKILFHTVILPLSDSEEYQMLRNFTGNSAKENFDLFTKNSNIVGEGVMSFDLDEILYQIGKEEGVVEDIQKLGSTEEIQRCKRELGEEICAQIANSDLPEKEIVVLVMEGVMKEYLFAEIPWEGRIFDFVGDEIALHIGNDMVFDFDSFDTAGIDAFISVKLKDSKKGEKFFLAVVKSFAKQFNGGGWFGININKPLKNHWNEKSYYSVPTGFINIFAYFEKDRVSFAVSQKTIHSIIDGKISASEENFQRLDQFLSGAKNVYLRADTQKIVGWLDMLPEIMKAEFSENIMSEILGTRGMNNQTYEAEYFLLQNLLGENFMKQNFSSYPVRLGYKAVFEEKKLLWKDAKTEETVELEEIYKNTDIITIAKNFVGAYGTAGLSFAFTDHGAEIKIAFDNVASDGKDERFEGGEKKNFVEKILEMPSLQGMASLGTGNFSKIFLGGIGGTLLILAGAWFVLRRKS